VIASGGVRNWANAPNFTAILLIWMPRFAPTCSFLPPYYLPNHAVLLLLGDVKATEGIVLAEKYFEAFRLGRAQFADPTEPEQTEERHVSFRKIRHTARDGPSDT